MSDHTNIKYRVTEGRPLTWSELDTNFNELSLVIQEFNTFKTTEYDVFYSAQVTKNSAYDDALVEFEARISQNETDINNLGAGGDVEFNSITVNNLTSNTSLVIDSDVVVGGTAYFTNMDMAGDAQIDGTLNVTGATTLANFSFSAFGNATTQSIVGRENASIRATSGSLQEGKEYNLRATATFTLPASASGIVGVHNRVISVYREGDFTPTVQASGADQIFTPIGADTDVLIDTDQNFYFVAVTGGWEMK